MWATVPVSSSTKAQAGRFAVPGDGAFDMTSAPTAPTTLSPAASGADRRPPVQVRLKSSRRPPRVGLSADGGPARGTCGRAPGLLAVSAVCRGRIERVSYRVADWAPTADKSSSSGVASFESRGLRTAGRTMDVLAVRRRVTLLVVASVTSSQAARDALWGLVVTTQTALTGCVPAGAQPSRRGRVGGAEESAVQRWELGGGGVHGG